MVQDLSDPSQLGTYKHMLWSYEQLRKFREFRHMALEEVGGYYWSREADSQPRVLVNMLELATRIYSSILTPAKPRVMVTPREQLDRKPVARALEFATNRRIIDSELSTTLPFVTLDALFMMGIVAIGPVDDDVSQSFVGRVDPADWVHDARSAELGGVGYMGHRYELPKSVVREWPGLTKEVLKLLDEEDGSHRPVGSVHSDRTESLTQGGDHLPEFEPSVELWDLYFPRTRRIETYWHRISEEPIREHAFKGPKGGPYRVLRLGALPSNIVPAPPMAVWFDAHLIQSEMYRKVARQAQMLKTGMAYKKGSTDDADQVQAFGDGAIFGMDDPNSVVPKTVGEINPAVLNFAIHMNEMFSMGMGSLDTLGGLGSQAGTASQEQLISQSAHRVLSVYQREMERFLSGVMGDLAWYEWRNKKRRQEFFQQEPTTGIKIKFVWPPEEEKGKLDDFAFEVQPYSDTTDTPTGKANLLMQLWQTAVAPMAGVLAAKGVDMGEAAMKMLGDQAHLRDLPEIKEWLTTSSGEQEEQEGGQVPVRQSPATTRTNVRVNQSSERPGDQLQKTLSAAVGRQAAAAPQGA